MIVYLFVLPITLYLLYALVLYTSQERILFPGAGYGKAHQPQHFPNAKFVELPDSGVVMVMYDPEASVDEGERGEKGSLLEPWILVAHGNGERISSGAPEADAFRRRGIGVCLVEYPGYGGCSGEPGRESIGRAFCEAYDFLISDGGLPKKQLFGVGRSIGTGAITDLARSRELEGMVLLSPFAELTDMAVRRGVPRFLLKHRFDNISGVKDFEGSLLVIHGTEDQIIPFEDGKRVAGAHRDGALIDRPCGHNDLFLDDALMDAIEGLLKTPELPLGQ